MQRAVAGIQTREDSMADESTDSVRSRLSALLVPICTAPVMLVFSRDPGRALAAWVCAIALVISIRIFWERRRHLWFWVMVAGLTGLHVLLVLRVPWPSPHTPIGGPALVPIGLLDVGIMCGCFKLVESFTSKQGESDPVG